MVAETDAETDAETGSEAVTPALVRLPVSESRFGAGNGGARQRTAMAAATARTPVRLLLHAFLCNALANVIPRMHSA